MKSVEQIWQRHCRERERQHLQQVEMMQSRLSTMKTQMSKLRREMSDLEAELRNTEQHRMKEIAREKQLLERFRENLAAVTDCVWQQLDLVLENHRDSVTKLRCVKKNWTLRHTGLTSPKQAGYLQMGEIPFRTDFW